MAKLEAFFSMIATRKRQTPWQVAVHEAGHSVAVLHFGGELLRVNAIGDESFAGRIWSSGLSAGESLVMILAGAAAGQRFAGALPDWENTCGSDLRSAVECLRVLLGFTPGDPFRYPMFERAWSKALELVARHRRAVVAIAEELGRRGELSGAKVEKIFRRNGGREGQLG
jgi:hypothetical protein